MSADEMRAVLERISTTTARDEAASWPIIIEAAPEDLSLKQEIFASLSKLSVPETMRNALEARRRSVCSTTAIAAGRPNTTSSMVPKTTRPLCTRSSPDDFWGRLCGRLGRTG